MVSLLASAAKGSDKQQGAAPSGTHKETPASRRQFGGADMLVSGLVNLAATIDIWGAAHPKAN